MVEIERQDLAMNPFDTFDYVIIDGKRYTKKQLQTLKPNPTLPTSLKLVVDAVHLNHAFHQLSLGKNLVLDEQSLNFYQNYRRNLCPAEITNSLDNKLASQFQQNLASWKKLVKEFGGGCDQGLFSSLLPKITVHQLQTSKSAKLKITQSVAPVLLPLRNFILNNAITATIFISIAEAPISLSLKKKSSPASVFY